MKIGDRVKMTDYFKRNSPNSKDHIDEFGSCSGVIIGYIDIQTSDDVDVRWMPSGLKYGYTIDSLELDKQYYRDKNIDKIINAVA